MSNRFFPLTPKEAEKLGVKYSSKDNKAAGFPSRLRDLRTEAGKSQQKLADEIGVTKSTIGLYEAGDNVPDAKTICKLAKFYRVSTDYLLGLSEVKSTEFDIKAICELTGLTEKSVAYLKENKNSNSDDVSIVATTIDKLINSLKNDLDHAVVVLTHVNSKPIIKAEETSNADNE